MKKVIETLQEFWGPISGTIEVIVLFFQAYDLGAIKQFRFLIVLPTLVILRFMKETVVYKSIPFNPVSKTEYSFPKSYKWAKGLADSHCFNRYSTGNTVSPIILY